MNKEHFGTLLALTTAIISGFAIPINKIFVTGLEPTVFTAVRALIIGLVFLILSLLRKDISVKKFRKLPFGYLLTIGIIGGGLAFLLFFTGLKLTTGSRAAFLHKTLPIYVTIFAYFFLKERIKKKQLYALLVMLAGTFALLSATINPSFLWMNPSLGDMLILGAIILWAVENTVAKKVLMKESNLIVSFARMFFGSMVLFAAVILFGNVGILLSLTGQQIINILISTGILFGYVLFWYWSLKYINVSKAASLLLIAPVISLALGVIMFGEPVPLLQIAGSALILIGARYMIRVKSEMATGV